MDERQNRINRYKNRRVTNPRSRDFRAPPVQEQPGFPPPKKPPLPDPTPGPGGIGIRPAPDVPPGPGGIGIASVHPRQAPMMPTGPGAPGSRFAGLSENRRGPRPVPRPVPLVPGRRGAAPPIGSGFAGLRR